MKESKFFPQAKLMLECLTTTASFPDFALKGGTAINFFIYDMPRLSVDIDLTYLPIKDRDTTLRDISDQLKQMADSIEMDMPGTRVTKSSHRGQTNITKLFVERDNVQIKIEPNEVIRGTLFKPKNITNSSAVQDLFEMEVDTQVLSFEDLYGGKICAALDRQHPRDLYDIDRLFKDKKKISDKLRQAFIVYLLSHDRPINEVISPNLKDISGIYENEFKGMTEEKISLDDLLAARSKLIEEIHKGLTVKEKEFILSIKKGDPNWTLFPHKIDQFPAIQWKLRNIEKLKQSNAEKHDKLLKELERKLKL